MSKVGKDYIFIHNPKCAGTSIEKIIGGSSHETIYGYWKNGIDISKYNTFMIVRNPYERIVSAYGQLLRYNHHIKHISNIQEILSSFENYIYSLDLFFDFTLLNYSESYTPVLDDHSAPQNYWCCIDGINVIDFIFKFEELHIRWPEIQNMIGTKEKLPVLNKSGYGAKYLNYFNRSLLDVVNHKYKKSFLMFGYERL